MAERLLQKVGTTEVVRWPTRHGQGHRFQENRAVLGGPAEDDLSSSGTESSPSSEFQGRAHLPSELRCCKSQKWEDSGENCTGHPVEVRDGITVFNRMDRRDLESCHRLFKGQRRLQVLLCRKTRLSSAGHGSTPLCQRVLSDAAP